MITDIRSVIGCEGHAFAENSKWILGGIEIPFEKGLAGHSDADAVLHAITDAILGSLALGDIGSHFPDTDEKNKNADSKIFLIHAIKLIGERGYQINNVDVTVALQKPKLQKYIPQMKKNIAEILNKSEEDISVKETTTEKLGFIGSEEGIAAMATVTIIKPG